MKSLRSVIYVFGTVAIVATVYAAGLFPTGLSASEKLAASWAEDFGCRAKSNAAGEVVLLKIGSPQFGDADCRKLSCMLQLESLDLSGTGITDDGLAELAKLPALTTLKLAGTAVTDQGLAVLATASALRELSLTRCSLKQLTVAGVGQLTSLKSLNLMDTPVGDDSGEALARLANLEQLYIGRTRISSDILSWLTDLPSIQLLNVAGVAVNEASDMRALGRLPTLELLYLDRAELNDAAFGELTSALKGNEDCRVSAIFLEGCDITDESREALLELVQLPALGKLRLTGTQVSRDVFNELVKAVPEISYAHGSGQSED